MEIIEIHKMNDVYLEGLSSLLIDVVDNGASVGFLSPLILEDAKSYWKEVLQNKGVILWVAVIAGHIVGAIQLYLCQKQNGKHRGEIAKLIVHSKARRMGIGKDLIKLAEERARKEGLKLLTLDTRGGDVSNLLYKARGYIEAGRIPKYAQSSNGELHETVLYYKMI
ncbi:GNAT family N-acetyltransferase [Clostridium manihotivorum]|uniref:GNAT family N-acetyltransferase n=1 Tax=Clostridium manihotivorum TaxID=2320868 RepID=A0A3R5QYL6_9CLOT|nr:GNAT family N-acetyltransferase [Clostridium manihotivorum]